ncbi:MAG: NusG domain II-containing protein [Oscillospiraceae bacterium]|jgi:hypothetical protein|nr:NusG domain II-containing protein [Oscillospiraceae bacterium]
MLKRFGFTKADIALILLLLSIAGVGFVMPVFRARAPALSVVIRVDGEVYRQLPLYADPYDAVEIDIDGHNTLIISGGEVYMAHADCPDKLCVKQGVISRNGERIVCLPNQISAAIE